MTYDCLIVGGGVIGLSLAWELASAGQKVGLIDHQEIGKEASWAGAGILPPANRRTATHPFDHLRGLSFDLHPQWSARLQEETGTDNGYRSCGGLYLARSSGEAAALMGWADLLQAEGIRFESLDATDVGALEPALTNTSRLGRIQRAMLVPDECQIRNPRHLQALHAACKLRGVAFFPHTRIESFDIQHGKIHRLRTSAGTFTAASFALTCGAWTHQVLAPLNISLSVIPVRGQMVLFRTDQPKFRRIINEGPRYLVPRDDGRVLAGSTEEEVGFDKSTTTEAVETLIQFAQGLIPDLNSACVEKSWAGLRPATFDGLPYLGTIPGLANAYVAAGHFRSGLYLSTGTAVVMSQLIRGTETETSLHPFRVSRG